MNLRCSYCQTPFTIGRIEKLDALQHMDANNLTHYDVHCPRCRRSTPVVRQRLEMTMPNWREALKELEKEMKANPQQEAPLPTPEPESAPVTESKPAHRHHRTRAGKAAKKEEEKPAPKPKKAPTLAPNASAGEKPTAKKDEEKPAAKPKAEKKPAAPKSPAKGKAPAKKSK